MHTEIHSDISDMLITSKISFTSTLQQNVYIHMRLLKQMLPNLPISTPRPPIPLRNTWDWAIFCIAMSPRTYLWRLWQRSIQIKTTYKQNQEHI